MAIYVYLKRRKDHGIYFPNFEIHDAMPEVAEEEKRRIHALEDGECIYVGKFSFSEDLTYIKAVHYRVSNIAGRAEEEVLDRYTLPRFGKSEEADNG
jgi:hypothetical protein